MEDDWVYQLERKPYAEIDRLKRFLEAGGEASMNLLILNRELDGGWNPTKSFCNFRSSITNMCYLLLSIVKTHKEEQEEDEVDKDVKAFMEDLRNLMEFLTGTGSESALNEAREGKTGALLNQKTLMETLLNSYFYDVVQAAFNETREELPKRFVDEVLKKGSLIPKFKELGRVEPVKGS